MANISKLLSLINGVPRTIDFSNASNTLTLNGGLDLSGNLELNGSTSGYVIINASATTSTYSLTMPPAQAASSGYVLTNDGTGVLSWANPSSGSVTSVALALPSIFNVSGSPVTSSGTLTATLANEAANSFFAGPSSGSAAAPTFRAIVAADIPTLNQNTTGTAANITATSNSTLTTLSSLSLPTSQLTGTIQASNFPALTGDVTTTAGSFATSLVATSNGTITTLSALTTASSLASVGTITSGTWNGTTIAIANGGTGQTTKAAAFNALAPNTATGGLIVGSATNTYGNLPIGSAGQVLTVSGGTAAWAAPATSGTVTSVAFADDSTAPIYSVSGSPVTSSGTLAITLNTQTANTVFAGPSSGSAAQPGFRALVAADIPSLSATYVTQSEVGANNGVASLDGGGKVPLSQLPATLMEFKGSWNPNTNTPTLADGTGTTGFTYWVSAADSGTVAGLNDPSMTNFQIGDLVIYNGSAWVLVTPAAGVQSVNGAQGAVSMSMATANGFAGTYSGTALTVSTTITGILQGNGTAISAASTTGTGNVVLSNSPTLVTPALGTPSALVGTNITGTAAGLTAGTVTTNANLTGDVTSVGNATSLVATSNGTLTTLSALTTASSLSSVGTITSGTWNGTTIAIAHGGTGQTSAAAAYNALSPMTTTGDIEYEASANTAARLAIGSTGQVLTVVGGIPAWATPSLTPGEIALPTNDILVGNASNVAAAVAMSGDVTIVASGATTIGAGKVTASKLGTVTDGVTLDQSGAGGTIEIKPAGVSATQLATGAFDQVTILGGAGTPAYVASSPANIQMFPAGQTFAANTSYAVRMSMSGDAGFVAGQVVSADDNANSADNFWVIGIAFSAAGVSQGSPIAVVSLGTYTFGSGDTGFTGTAVAGKPVYLASSGGFTMTPPSTSGYADFKIGMMETTTTIFVNGQMMGIA